MTSYLFLLAIAAQASVFLGLRGLRFRSHAGLSWFAGLQFTIVTWIAVRIAGQSDPDGITWLFLQQFWFALEIGFWTNFALTYTGTLPRNSPWLFLPFLGATVLPVLLLTNGPSGWYFTGFVQGTELRGTPGPLYFGKIVVDFAWTLLSIFALLAHALRTRGRQRRVSTALFLVSLIPLAGATVTELDALFHGGRATLPSFILPSLIVSVLVSGWYTFRTILDPRPLAREHVFAHLKSSIVVLDAEGHVVDLNVAARKLLAQVGVTLGSNLREIDTPLRKVVLANLHRQGLIEPWDFEISANGTTYVLVAESEQLYDQSGEVAGWVLTIRPLGTSKKLGLMKQFELSVREQEIAECLNQGMSNKEISLFLQIEVNTVKNHVYNIFRKCSVGSRSELLRTLRDSF